MKRPTLTDVAREAGVSRATACRALGPACGLHSEATRRLVKEAARRVGYKRRRPAAEFESALDDRFVVLRAGSGMGLDRAAVLAYRRNDKARRDGTPPLWRVYELVPRGGAR